MKRTGKQKTVESHKRFLKTKAKIIEFSFLVVSDRTTVIVAYFSDGCVLPINALHCLLKLPARQDTLDNEDSFFTAAFTISCGMGAILN